MKIGEILLHRGLISRDQLDRALAAQRRWGVRLGVSMVRLGFLDETSLAVSLTEQLGVPLAPATALDRIPAEVLARVPAPVALSHKIIPIKVEADVVHVCLADPQNLLRIEDIAHTLGCAIQPCLATEMLIERALARYYRPPPADADPAAAEVEGDRVMVPDEPRAPKETPPAAPLEGEPAARPPAEPPRGPPAAGGSSDRQQSALQALARALSTVRREIGATAGRPAAGEPDDAEMIEFPDKEQKTEPDRPAALASNPYDSLAAKTTRGEVAVALFSFLADIFPTACVLDTEGASARCVGLRSGGTTTDGAAVGRIPFVADAAWLRESGRSRPGVVEEVKDPHLALMLERLGLPTAGIFVAPILDGTAPALVALCAGLTEGDLRPLGGKLRPYLMSAADALKMTALREQILKRGRGEPLERVVTDETSVRHRDFSGAATDPALIAGGQRSRRR